MVCHTINLPDCEGSWKAFLPCCLFSCGATEYLKAKQHVFCLLAWCLVELVICKGRTGNAQCRRTKPPCVTVTALNKTKASSIFCQSGDQEVQLWCCAWYPAKWIWRQNFRTNMTTWCYNCKKKTKALDHLTLHVLYISRRWLAISAKYQWPAPAVMIKLRRCPQ